MRKIVSAKIDIDEIIKSTLGINLEEIAYKNMPIIINNQAVGVINNKEDIHLWFDFIPNFILKDGVMIFSDLEIIIKQ